MPFARIRIYFLETRPRFLLLSAALACVGGAVAYSHGQFDFLRFMLTAIGLVLAHIGVNVLNDYFDFNSGLDMSTKRTPFSGGSGILAEGLLEAKSVYRFGLAALAAALGMGIYLTIVSGWKLLPLIIAGGLMAYFYTGYLTKWLAGELAAGLGLGVMPVLGGYFVQTGRFGLEIAAVSVVCGLLTALLLFLNEFPDVESDSGAGRLNLVIALGRKKAANLYAVCAGGVYFLIIGMVALRLVPATCLVALCSIPFASAAAFWAAGYSGKKELPMGALGANVIFVLSTDVLLAVGYLV